METLRGFPNLPALWLRWAKPTSANAIAETLRGFPNLPATGAREARVGQVWGVLALVPVGDALATVREAHLRRRDRGNPVRVS